MTLSVADTREPVIEDDTFRVLDELLRFRHFRRYYFEFEYDWDRLDFLDKKYLEVQDLIKRDFRRFKDFLSALGNQT